MVRKTYAMVLLVKHKRGNGATGVGMVTGLTADTNSGAAPAVLVLGSRDGASGHRHGRVSGGSVEVEITGVVDGEQPANGVPYIPSRLGQ